MSILNYKFSFYILNVNFEFGNLRQYEHERHGISLSTENFVCCNGNTILLACKISRSFADHSSKILISKIDKFDTGVTMIIQKNRRVNFESKFNTFRNQMPSRKHLSTSIKYCRFRKKYNSILCGVGKKLNFLRRV